MTIGPDEVRTRLETAYNVFLSRDAHLLAVNANERSITHKLAEYLQLEFPEWNVDCEYNRVGDLPKRLIGAVEPVLSDDTDGTTVYPDIIVHHRGSAENLLVIEAKKSTTAVGGGDTDKLKAYKSEHGYLFAYAVVVPVGTAADLADAARDLQEVGV